MAPSSEAQSSQELSCTVLQDQDLTTGPTRILEGSHCNTEPLSLTLPLEDSRRPGLPRESLLRCPAGSFIFLHCDVIHAGSANTSGR